MFRPRVLAMSFKSALLCAALAQFGCGQKVENAAELKFDAALSQAMTGTIADGVVVSDTSSTSVAQSYVRAQLYYTVGQLNQYQGVADLSRNIINITRVDPRPDGLYDVHYTAQLFVAWPRSRAAQTQIGLIMPANMDRIEDFITAYANCRDDFSHPPEQGNFWYFYRPERCVLARPAPQEDNGVIRRFPMTFTLHNDNTSGKSPEYGKIWEDGQLVVTAIFAKDEPGSNDANDVGTSAYNSFYRDLVATFGRPTSQSVSFVGQPGPRIADVEMSFQTQRGPMNVAIMLVDGIRALNGQQMSRYAERTRTSDYVSYNGHSGLGANIRALTNLGDFQTGQYQLFLVNGCDTFAYVDNSLRDAHAAVNPGHTPNKFFDIITNAMPAYFSMLSRTNINVIGSLIVQQRTYRQILQTFDSSQMAVVTGEEDNNWPGNF